MSFEPRDPGFEERTRDSIGRQSMLTTMGVAIEAVRPGEVILAMPHDARFTQQHGFLHGGATAAVLDAACGFAALSLMPREAGVLTVEFKTSFLAPGRGERYRFRGRVVRPTRALIFAEAEARAIRDGDERPIARMTATMMVVTGRDDVRG